MSKESYFIGCAEVAELVGCGKSRAYKYIQQMVIRNLEAKGETSRFRPGAPAVCDGTFWSFGGGAGG